MITLARLDGSKLTVNAEMIEFVESTPDTVISLVSGKRVIVKDPVAEVVRQVIEYRRQTLAGIFVGCGLASGRGERQGNG